MNPAATGKAGRRRSIGRGAERADARAALEALLDQGRGSRAGRRHPLRRQPAEGGGGALDGGEGRACSSSRSRPSASMSAPRRRSITCSSSRCRRGMAVLLISSDFEEVERICHRALVFSRGRVVAEIPHDELDDRAPDGERLGRRVGRAGWSCVMSGQASPRYLGSAVTRAISVWGLLVLLVLLDHRLLAAEARHLPHLLQHPLDPLQQVGAGAGRALGVHPDDGQPVRPLGRVQRRHLPGARHRAAGAGAALVGARSSPSS